ncbi:MAG: phosphatidylserine decarboxylase [Pseudomonadota bacterium]
MRMRDAVLFPLHREGWKFVPIFAGITLLAWLIWAPLGLIGAALTVWCYYFFRDPVRTVPGGDTVIISPADGIVSLIEQVPPPGELGLDPTPRTRVSVFMNVFNCHVNRVPRAGRISQVVYHPGKFLNASLDKASEENERNVVVVEMEEGETLVVVQIAGLVARRIVCDVSAGDRLATGERFGMIRFGSRLDIYLPQGTTPRVSVGQTMISGETVLAHYGDDTPAKAARVI